MIKMLLKTLKKIETNVNFSLVSGSSNSFILIILPSAGETIQFSSVGTILFGSLKKFKQKINKIRRNIFIKNKYF